MESCWILLKVGHTVMEICCWGKQPVVVLYLNYINYVTILCFMCSMVLKCFINGVDVGTNWQGSIVEETQPTLLTLSFRQQIWHVRWYNTDFATKKFMFRGLEKVSKVWNNQYMDTLDRASLCKCWKFQLTWLLLTFLRYNRLKHLKQWWT